MFSLSAASPENKKSPANSRRRSQQVLRRMTLTAVFAALAVACKAFTNLALSIPGAGVKVGISGIFTFFPAILCGPLYGGAASALSDILGYLIAPDGAYIPWLTLTAFCGGVIKGVIWRLLTKKSAASVRWVLLAAFVLIGAFGATLNVALVRDGVMNGPVAVQSELPLRGEIDEMTASGRLSAVSRFGVGFAQYNKDSFTVASVDPALFGGGVCTLPSTATLLGVKGNVTKTAKNLLGDFRGRVIIPGNYSTIGENLANDPSAVTIVSTPGDGTKTAVQKYAEKYGYTFEAVSADEIEKIALTVDKETLTDAEKGISLTNADTYRKYLAQYLNVAVFGSELVGVIGILFILVTFFLGRVKGEEGEKTVSYLRIATAATTAGLIVTTINTFILRVFTPAWTGRTILVLLIPRIAEELVVCLIQAYVISLLWAVIARGSVKRYIDKL